MENTNMKSNETDSKLDFDIDKFSTELAESIRHMQETCDYIQKCNEPKTMEDVAINMERIQKNMEWNKMCSIERKVDLLNDKLDMILKKLGGM